MKTISNEKAKLIRMFTGIILIFGYTLLMITISEIFNQNQFLLATIGLIGMISTFICFMLYDYSDEQEKKQ